jgi:hypothetical protein
MMMMMMNIHGGAQQRDSFVPSITTSTNYTPVLLVVFGNKMDVQVGLMWTVVSDVTPYVRRCNANIILTSSRFFSKSCEKTNHYYPTIQKRKRQNKPIVFQMERDT